MDTPGGGGGLPRFRLSGPGGAGSTPMRLGAGVGAGARGPSPTPGAASPSPFGRRGPIAPSPVMQRAASRQMSEEEKEAEGGWKGGPLQPHNPDMYRRPSAALGPLQSAQGTGFEISHEIDSLRAELNELRMSNAALQHTNGELHAALSQVTERSKLLSTEHARFLDEFRDKSQRSKQKLLNDRQSLKTNLSETNRRLEELEKLNESIENEKLKVLRRLDELTSEHDSLSGSYASLQQEKQIWQQKEEEYLNIQQLQSRNLEELNATVLQIQEEREGWHARFEESQQELRRSQEHAHALESTINAQEGMIGQLNNSVLTSQEEIINLTQSLATHLEQIANISKQNKELHATLVQFTRTNDKGYVEEMLPNLSNESLDLGGVGRIDLLHPSPSAAHEAALNASINPSFTGPVPAHIHSPAFLTPNSSPRGGGGGGGAAFGSPSRAHPTTSSAAYNFLHTTSSLSTLHLPASTITAKLSSYILWILEHKQILENMMQRKEKLRKELEEQIVVANVEAQVHDQMQSPSRAGGGGGGGFGSHPASPTSPIRMRSASPMQGQFSPRQSGGVASLPLPDSALPPPTLLLPSLLQHTLHDLHELTHLTQHDALQYANFEREKMAILKQCSSSGFNKYNAKRAKNAFALWGLALKQRVHRREVLDRLVQKHRLRHVAWAFARFRTRVMVHLGQTLMLQQCNDMKRRIVAKMLAKSAQSDEHAQQLVFRAWVSTSRRSKRMKQRLCSALANVAENRIVKLWTRWKTTTLQLRHVATVEQAQEDAEAQAANFRATQLEKMQRMVVRRLMAGSAQTQRSMFISWRSWSSARRARKHQALRRIICVARGQGMLIRALAAWKEFRRTKDVAQASQLLTTTRAQAVERFERQRLLFVDGFTKLRDRYRNFKLWHWWRLAYVDTQWLAREEQWRRALHGQKQLQVRTLVRMRANHSFLPIFTAWKQQVRESKSAKLRSAQKIFLRLINIPKAHAFRRWGVFTEEARVAELRGKLGASQSELQQRKTQFAQTLINRWRQQNLSTAFQHLRDQVRVRRARKRELLDRTIRRLAHSGLHRALRTWQHFSEQCAVASLKHTLAAQITASKKKRCADLIKRWRSASLVPAWTQWQNFIAVRKQRRRELLDRTCKRLQHSMVWRALRAWQHFSEQTAIAQLKTRIAETQQQASNQRLRLAEHMLTQWRTSRCKVRFVAWRTFTKENRAHKRSVLDRTLKHLSSGYLGRGFSLWKKFVEGSRLADMRALLNENKHRTAMQAVTKWRHRIVTGPFLNWRNHARKARAHKRDVLDRMVRRLMHAQLARGWRTWTHFIDNTKVAYMRRKFLGAKDELTQEIALQKQKRIATLIQRWRGASLSTRFQQWRIYARTNRSKKKVRLDQILRRMAWSSAAKALRRWGEFVSLHRAHEAAQRAQGAMVELRRQNTLEVQNVRTRHILTKTLDRMSNLLLFSGWRGWLEFNAASKANDIERARRRLEQQTAQLQARQAELVRQHSATTLQAQHRLVDKTLRRIAYSTLYQALRIWKKEAEDRGVADMRRSMKDKEVALKMRIVATKIASRRKDCLQPVMLRWHKYASERRARKRQLTEKVILRMTNIALYQSLRQWREWAQQHAVETLRNKLSGQLAHQKKARCEALIRTWRHRSLQPTFAAWTAFARENAKRKRTLAKVLGRFAHAQLARGWRTWKTFNDKQHQHELSTSLQLLRTTAVQSKLASLLRASARQAFLDWRRHARSSRREAGMVEEMRQFRRCDVIDRTLRRIQATSTLRSFQTWRAYILRARLVANDKLGEYSEMILSLRAQSEHDSLKLHEYLGENQRLKSSLLSIKHKQHTMSLLGDKQKENRAVLFAYNTILSKSFRAFYQRVHFLRRRKLALHKAAQHVADSAALRALQLWRHQSMRHRSHMTQLALEAAKKQLDQCLGKVWSLESQLAQRAAESDSVMAESQQLLLNAQAQELNHQLEKQMPSEREVRLAEEVDTMAAKLELLLKEVRERGSHIQFLSAENQRLSAIVKSSGSMGFSSGAPADLSATANNNTLNLSTASFARSRGAAGGLSSSRYQPTSSFAAASPANASAAKTQFFPAGNASFSS